ncbi:replicative DNA helicase [Deinococcus roseus]|uniref:Replicative DNA helicase n=1 Tax=Deinococcus roseus TaxID=392414 RepID=A0ABQ2DFG0_9DEIO|nr:replicative DNA helicase [Deinococcus roseus]GGJ56178.1 hypothetical protein GCM10008938_47920 [Deinococcus roseus]
MDPVARVAPNSIDAEVSVLGSILLDNDTLINLGDQVNSDMFYRESHRKIFAAMRLLADQGQPIDLVTLSEELRGKNVLDEVGGVSYLVGLSESVPTAVYAEYYARIIQEKYTLRQLIQASGRIMQLAYDGEVPLDEMLDKSEQLIFDVSQKEGKDEFQSMNTVMHDTFEYITKLHATGGHIDGTKSGFRDLDSMITGFSPGSLNVLAARPSMGKCLTANTLIDVPGTGQRITIEEFVQRNLPEVYGISETGKLRPTKVSHWIDSGVKPVRRVRTRLGREVEVTLHHPFLTPEGWTPLYDLKLGDVIAVPRAVPNFGADEGLDSAEVRLLAYFIAEGNLTNTSPRFTNTDPLIVQDFKTLIGQKFPELGIKQDGIDFIVARAHTPGAQKNQKNPLTEFLRSHGQMGKSAHFKTVPEAIFTLQKEKVAEFLCILFSCDATIYSLNGKHPRIEFTVASLQLAKDVQHLLTRFGIIAKLWQKTEKSFRVEITEPQGVALYQTEIGWFGEKATRVFELHPERHSNNGHLPASVWEKVRALASQKQLSLTQLAMRSGEHTGKRYNPHTQRGIPQKRLAGYAAVLESPELARLSSPDLYWDEIVSIEDLGEQQVYDLTVPDGSNFVAQDICVHNTAFALSIAQNVALRGEGKTTAVFSLEMPAQQLALRMLCSEARVDMNRVRSGQLSEQDFVRLANAAARLSEAPIFIDDVPNLTVNELRSKLRRVKVKTGSLGLVVIDYLQLMSGSKSGGGGENRQQEISAISRGLKSIARELEVPVIVLSQLSRAVEQRPNHRPMLSDLRECVTGDTLVMLSNGQRMPIRELVGTNPEVLAMTEDEKIGAFTSDKVWSVGIKPVFEVKLASGRTLRATAKHRIYTAHGWQELQHIQEGSRVAVARVIPEPAETQKWTEAELVLLGHLVGDGSYLKGQPLRYTTASEANSKLVTDSALTFGVQVNRHPGKGNWHQLVFSGNGNRWEAKGINKWLRDLGSFNQRSHEKHLPASLFRLSNDQVALFLQNLWATDGTLFTPKASKSSSRINFSTNSLQLARDVAALLLRFGIVARFRTVQQGDYRPMHVVEISGKTQQMLFLDRIGATGCKVEDAARLRSYLEAREANTNTDTLPVEVFDVVRSRMQEQGITTRQMAALRGTSYAGSSHFKFAPSRTVLLDHAEILNDVELQKKATSDLFWDEVVSITPAGEEEVFDLTVPGPASWLADGIVSHNSGAIEQDADIVMFIYRDEYYNKETDQQGIAEIIIGKQRNGPVGTVKLQFHSQHVRFNDLAQDGV